MYTKKCLNTAVPDVWVTCEERRDMCHEKTRGLASTVAFIATRKHTWTRNPVSSSCPSRILLLSSSCPSLVLFLSSWCLQLSCCLLAGLCPPGAFGVVTVVLFLSSPVPPSCRLGVLLLFPKQFPLSLSSQGFVCSVGRAALFRSVCPAWPGLVVCLSCLFTFSALLTTALSGPCPLLGHAIFSSSNCKYQDKREDSGHNIRRGQPLWPALVFPKREPQQ